MSHTFEQIEKQIDKLSLQEQLSLIELLARKLQEKTSKSTIPKKPFPGGLEGILEGTEFSENDIAEARREMWGTLGEKEI